MLLRERPIERTIFCKTKSGQPCVYFCDEVGQAPARVAAPKANQSGTKATYHVVLLYLLT